MKQVWGVASDLQCMQSAHAHALQIYKNVKICTFFLKTHKTSQIGLYVGKASTTQKGQNQRRVKKLNTERN